jgi:hypothetical protein
MSTEAQNAREEEERATETADIHDSEAVDPCGCASRPYAAAAPDNACANLPTTEQPCEGSLSPSDTVAATVRAVKLVALLQPEGAGYRAQLAAGAENCDPELRLIEVPDLQSAIDALPAVLAAAEARWQAQPRYPSAPRSPATAPRPRAPGPPRTAAPQTNRTGAPAPTTRPPVPATPTSSGPPNADQLSLFG